MTMEDPEPDFQALTSIEVADIEAHDGQGVQQFGANHDALRKSAAPRFKLEACIEGLQVDKWPPDEGYGQQEVAPDNDAHSDGDSSDSDVDDQIPPDEPVSKPLDLSIFSENDWKHIAMDGDRRRSMNEIFDLVAHPDTSRVESPKCRFIDIVALARQSHAGSPCAPSSQHLSDHMHTLEAPESAGNLNRQEPEARTASMHSHHSIPEPFLADLHETDRKVHQHTPLDTAP